MCSQSWSNIISGATSKNITLTKVQFKNHTQRLNVWLYDLLNPLCRRPWIATNQIITALLRKRLAEGNQGVSLLDPGFTRQHTLGKIARLLVFILPRQKIRFPGWDLGDQRNLKGCGGRTSKLMQKRLRGASPRKAAGRLGEASFLGTQPRLDRSIWHWNPRVKPVRRCIALDWQFPFQNFPRGQWRHYYQM